MKFLHSMIRVKNEEKSIRFYCELLGLKRGARIRLEDCYLQYLIDEKTGVEIELTMKFLMMDIKTAELLVISHLSVKI